MELEKVICTDPYGCSREATAYFKWVENMSMPAQARCDRHQDFKRKHAAWMTKEEYLAALVMES